MIPAATSAATGRGTVRSDSKPADDGLVEFSEYVQVLRRRRALILVLLIIGLAAGFAYSKYRPKSYTADATVQVRPSTVDIVTGGWDSSSININTQQSVLASTTVASAVRSKMHSTKTPEQLLSDLKVQAPTKANTLALQYSASNAKDAADYANAFATSYLSIRQNQAQSALNTVVKREQDKLTGLQQKLAKVQNTVATSTPGTSQYNTATVNQNLLLQQINPIQTKLEDLNTLVVDPGSVIVSAQPPTSAAGLSRTVLIAVGGLIGLLLGIVLAFLRDRRDDRLRSVADAGRLLSMPIIGMLPRSRGAAGTPTFPTGHPATRLALGAVVARLVPLAEREQVRTILLTSPASADAAEAAGVDVALALADSGMRVCLVTANPARLQPEWLPADGRLRVTDSDALRSGGDLLNPDRVRMILAEMREYADFVVVVGPPVLGSPDSLVLAERADGVLVVVERRARAFEVQQACAAISDVGGLLLGTVLRGFTRSVAGPRVGTPATTAGEAAAPAPVTSSSSS
jgi:capsular polysaccharide biosynthesis protein